MAHLANPVHSFRISLGLSTSQVRLGKLSPFDLPTAALFHTWFEVNQVVEIKVENTVFHR
jgi:hypothetical protein